MGYHVMTAALVREVIEGPSHRVSLVEPLYPQIIPRPLGVTEAPIRAAPFNAFLVFWADEEGPVTITTIVLFPQGDDRDTVTINTQLAASGDRFLFRVQVPIEIRELLHRVSGVYYIRCLASGEPLASFALPVYWEDEFPIQ